MRITQDDHACYCSGLKTWKVSNLRSRSFNILRETRWCKKTTTTPEQRKNRSSKAACKICTFYISGPHFCAHFQMLLWKKIGAFFKTQKCNSPQCFHRTWPGLWPVLRWFFTFENGKPDWCNMLVQVDCVKCVLVNTFLNIKMATSVTVFRLQAAHYKITRIFISQLHFNLHRNLSYWHCVH